MNSQCGVSRRSFLAGTASLAASAVTLATVPGWAKDESDEEKKIGFALVGIGNLSMGQLLPAFAKCKTARPAALVSGHPDKAKQQAEKYGIDPKNIYNYQNYDTIRDNPEVDVIYIVLPNGMHAEYTIRGHQAGKHVLCEKPLANTSDECQEMIATCRRANVKLMTAYRKYFEPSSVALKKLVDSRKLGRLKLIHSAFTFTLPPQQVWHLKRELAGGGSLWDVGVYCVNAVRWLTGLEPVEAAGYSWSADPERFKEVDESIAFQLKFPDDLFVQASSSFAAAKASFIQIHGEKGWVAVDPAFAYNEKKSLFGQIGGKWFSKEYPPSEEFHLELDHLAECIRSNREPEPDGLTGMRDVAVMETIYEAARLGRPVAIANRS